MNININVGLIGFSLHEKDRFKRIFGTTLERVRVYTFKELTIHNPVDLLIVKTSTESALKKLEVYQSYHGKVPIVTAGKNTIEGIKHHIEGVLIITRVLTTLDEVLIIPRKLKERAANSQGVADDDSVNMEGQYDILVVNDDASIRKLLKEELIKSEIPLNIDFAISGEEARKKIKHKYYDFLFIDDQTPNYNEIEQSIRKKDQDSVRPSVVMPTPKGEAIEDVHVVLRVLKAFSDIDDISNTQETTGLIQQEGQSYNVLVVDDSEMMHKVLAIELRKAEIPLNIDYVFSGEAALDRVQKKKYDFIFLDIMMPGIDGFETCGKIRKMKEMSKLPIIMLTSKTSPLDEVKGIVAGCTTYLTKPIKSDDFQKMLIRIMRWLQNFKATT